MHPQVAYLDHEPHARTVPHHVLEHASRLTLGTKLLLQHWGHLVNQSLITLKSHLANKLRLRNWWEGGSLSPFVLEPSCLLYCRKEAGEQSCVYIESRTRLTGAQPAANANAIPSGVTPRWRPRTSGFSRIAATSHALASPGSRNHVHISPPLGFSIPTILLSALSMQKVGTALSLRMISSLVRPLPGSSAGDDFWSGC